MLPSDELSDIRDEAEQALPDTCTIQTPTETNTKGSVAVTYANTYTNVACRLAGSNFKETERVIGEKLASAVTHVFTVPYDQALTAKDRVVKDGITYEVVAVGNTLASWRSVRRAYLMRVE